MKRLTTWRLQRAKVRLIDRTLLKFIILSGIYTEDSTVAPNYGQYKSTCSPLGVKKLYHQRK